jgi:hypothetical protein
MTNNIELSGGVKLTKTQESVINGNLNKLVEAHKSNGKSAYIHISDNGQSVLAELVVSGRTSVALTVSKRGKITSETYY